MNVTQIREQYHLDMRRNAFSSKRKKMSVLVRYKDKHAMLYVKGAGTQRLTHTLLLSYIFIAQHAEIAVHSPVGAGRARQTDSSSSRLDLPSPVSPYYASAEIILASCTSIVREDGSSLPLDDKRREELQQYITKLARQSLRAIW